MAVLTIRPTRCRSCGAAVVWSVTSNGRRMPLDAEPTSKGTHVLRVTDNPNAPHAVSRKEAAESEWEDGPRFVSHFATCPNAAVHRKRKKS